MAALLMLWGNPLWGGTLTWNANVESNLAGYKVYHCSQQPCSKSSGTATLLAILGKVTSFNIGTPVVTQYYFITAYNFANLESSASKVVTYFPAGTSPPPAATVSLTVLGSPTLGKPWAVQATTNASGTVSVQFRINGVLARTENNSPYCSFNDTSGSCILVQQPDGYYTVEARVLSNGIEVARQAIVVKATAVSSLAAATVSLTVLGSPTQDKPWAVQATTNASGTVSVQFRINGVLARTENNSPYCSFNDTSGSCILVQQPDGYYTVEARVLNNGIEVARQAIVVKAT
jgi:hypothetical protein